MTYEIRTRPVSPDSRFVDYHVCRVGMLSGVRCDAYADAVFLLHVLNNAGDDVLQAAREAAVKGERDAA